MQVTEMTNAPLATAGTQAALLSPSALTMTGTAATNQTAPAATDQPLLLLDRSFRIRSANHAFYMAFGLGREMVAGHVVSELFNRQWDTPELNDLLYRLRDGGEGEGEVEIVTRQPEGNLSRVRVQASCLTSPGPIKIMLRLQSVAMEKAPEVEAPAPRPVAPAPDPVAPATAAAAAPAAAAPAPASRNEAELAATLRDNSREINRCLALILGSARILETHPECPVRDDAENISHSASRLLEILVPLMSQARDASGAAKEPRDIQITLTGGDIKFGVAPVLTLSSESAEGAPRSWKVA